jgi:acyl carrier protein
MQELESLVYDAIKTVNETHEVDALNELEGDTPLFVLLDSLGTLDLVLELESRLQEKVGRYVQVADEYTMDGYYTPFKTVESLIAYLSTKIR